MIHLGSPPIGRVFGALLCVAVLSTSASTQSATTAGSRSGPAPTEDAGLYFIRAKRVITRPGESLEDAAVIVRGGKIVAVGRDLTKPEGAREIEGEVVCSAFLDPWSALGVSPDSLDDGSTSAATRSVDGIDFYAARNLREEALAAGVTCVRLQAGASARVGGIGAVIRLAPSLSSDAAIVLPDANVAMSVGLSANAPAPQFSVEQDGDQIFVSSAGSKFMDPFDRVAELDRLIAALEGGRNYLQAKVEYKHELEAWQKKIAEKEVELEKDFKKAKKDREKEEKDAKEKGKEFKEKAYKEDKKPAAPRYDEDNEVLARVANGELPLIVHAHRAGEIRALLSGSARFERLRLILAGGTEALACATELTARRIPVLVWPDLDDRGEPDELDGSDLSLAGRLSKAGITVLLGTGGHDASASRDLPLLAELVVGNGLAREKAFEALTLGAARYLDVADRLGSIERGKDAELLVLEGEPLSSTSHVRFVISGGRLVVSPKE